MAQVFVIENNIESAIILFRKRVAQDGILKAVRLRVRGDPKPSSKKKAKAMAAKKRRERTARRKRDDNG